MNMLLVKRRLLYKSMFGKNIFLLALAIVYVILAIVQANINGLFEAKFYHSIVFISFIVTSAELIRGLAKDIILYLREYNKTGESEIMLAKQHLYVFQEYHFLESETKYFQTISEQKQNLSEEKKDRKFINFFSNFDTIVSFIEVLLVVAVLLIFPLFNPPDSLNNRIILNVVSLITLAFAFISIFCNEFIAEDLKQSKEKIKYEIIHSNYYLDIIKKISMYQKNNNANEDKEFNDNEK